MKDVFLKRSRVNANASGFIISFWILANKGNDSFLPFYWSIFCKKKNLTLKR